MRLARSLARSLPSTAAAKLRWFRDEVAAGRALPSRRRSSSRLSDPVALSPSISQLPATAAKSALPSSLARRTTVVLMYCTHARVCLRLPFSRLSAYFVTFASETFLGRAGYNGGSNYFRLPNLSFLIGASLGCELGSPL